MSSSGGGISVTVGRVSAAVAATAAIVAGALIVPVVTGGGSGVTCDRNATTSTFSAQVSAATGGQTVCLATGSYGARTVSGTKSDYVTIRPAEGATVSIAPTVDAASDFWRFTEFPSPSQITSFDINDSTATSHIDLLNSYIENNVYMRLDNATNTNIRIAGNTFSSWNASGGPEGRLQIVQVSLPSSSIGVTVENNVFGPGGCSDGIQVGAYGVTIRNNEFVDIIQSGCDAFGHIDCLQGYGQSHTTITGNYFHGCTTTILAVDGGNNEMITNNVIKAASGSTNAFQTGSFDNSTIEHNVVIGTSANYDHKAGDPIATNGTIRDNVMVDSSGGGNFNVTCTGCSVSYNLFSSSGDASGTNSIVGTPVFVGGSNPTTWAGYQLAAGSPGKAAGHDGSDIGIVP